MESPQAIPQGEGSRERTESTISSVRKDAFSEKQDQILRLIGFIGFIEGNVFWIL